MKMAEVIAQRSPDPHQQVGAIIVDNNNIILGAGYNGMPRGVDQDRFGWDKDADFLYNRDTYVVHAEENAILNASQNVRGAEIYCTLFPCNECAKVIIQSGISEVIYKQMKTKHTTMAAEKLFESSGITWRYYENH